MTYLVDHPPAVPQFHRTRLKPVSGAIVVHTSENTPDDLGPDMGAENVAHWISIRPDPGSYHSIVDSDSTVHVGEYQWTMFHVRRHNSYTLGLAFATRADAWDEQPGEWVDAMIEQGAAEAARMADWIQSTTGVVVPAKQIRVGDAADGKPGFVTHSALDPTRRTDPGDRFPWSRFLARYTHHRERKLIDMPIIQWQQALVDHGHDLGTTGPNNDGVDGDFGALTLAASLRPVNDFDVVKQALIDSESGREMLAAQLAACEQDLRHDFTPEDAALGLATRLWAQAVNAATEQETH